MPGISSIETALPKYYYGHNQVEKVCRSWLDHSPDKLELFLRFLRASHTKDRYFIIKPEDFFSLKGLKNRANLFEEHAPALASQATEEALASARVTKDKINTLIFTSCSCPSIPAVDGLLIERLGLQRTTSRIPIFQHGCAGGIVGLEIASKLSSLQQTVCVVSTELCSLIFQSQNPTPAQLVGSAIFADGAACAVITPENKGLVFRDTQSFLIPNSRHLMGYDLLDDGFHLRLDRELPQKLVHTAPECIEKFLVKNHLKTEQIKYWLFHPGGAKILDFLEASLKLKPEQALWSWEVLRNVGNLSSASILFVLKAFLDSQVSQPGDKIIALGVGPGLTIELILFEWVLGDREI